MGRLSDQLERRRAEERAAFAKRFARYDRKSNRRALDALLDEVRRTVKVVATYSIKGGVGKTTTAVNLAYEAGRAGRAGAGVGPRSAGRGHLPAPGAAQGARRQPPPRVGQGRAGRPRARHRPRRGARAARRLLAPPPRRPPRGHPRADPADRRRSSSRCATTTTWRSSTARPASRWPARACSAPPTRCSCRSSPPRSPAARSASSPTFLDDQRRRAGGGAVPVDGRPSQAPAPRAGRLVGVGVARAARHHHPGRRGDRADGRRARAARAATRPTHAGRPRGYRRLWARGRHQPLGPATGAPERR